jgi:Flp pilus assembly protein TadG
MQGRFTARSHRGITQLLTSLRNVGLLAGRLAAATAGAAALEFGLVAAPFLALSLAIFETEIVFLAQQDLQAATSRAARQIMTGQAQAQSLTMNQFVQEVCNDAVWFSCGGLSVNVQKFSTFSSISMTNPVSNGNFSNSNFGFDIGGPGDIIVVQVFYLWPMVAGPFSFDLANVNGGYHLMVGTAAFRNEPT